MSMDDADECVRQTAARAVGLAGVSITQTDTEATLVYL